MQIGEYFHVTCSVLLLIYHFCWHNIMKFCVNKNSSDTLRITDKNQWDMGMSGCSPLCLDPQNGDQSSLR